MFLQEIWHHERILSSQPRRNRNTLGEYALKFVLYQNMSDKTIENVILNVVKIPAYLIQNIKFI